MSLQGHEKAARIIGEALSEEAADCRGGAASVEGQVLLRIARGYLTAAGRMAEEIKAGASGNAM